jgi:hypothetical protein
MKEAINVAINSSYFPYWDKDVPITEVLPEYNQLSDNDLLVLVANNVKIIGLYYAEDVGERESIPGLLYPMNLNLINPLQVELLYEDNFNNNHYQFRKELVEYIKVTYNKRYMWFHSGLL